MDILEIENIITTLEWCRRKVRDKILINRIKYSIDILEKELIYLKK